MQAPTTGDIIIPDYQQQQPPPPAGGMQDFQIEMRDPFAVGGPRKGKGGMALKLVAVVLLVAGLCAGSYFAGGGGLKPGGAEPADAPAPPAPGIAGLAPDVAAVLASQHPDELQSQCQLNGHSATDCLQAQQHGRTQLIDALSARPAGAGLTTDYLQSLSTNQLAAMAAADTHITQATVDAATQSAAQGLAGLIGDTDGCIMQLPSLPDTILSLADSSLADIVDEVVSITHSLSVQDWTMILMLETCTVDEVTCSDLNDCSCSDCSDCSQACVADSNGMCSWSLNDHGHPEYGGYCEGAGGLSFCPADVTWQEQSVFDEENPDYPSTAKIQEVLAHISTGVAALRPLVSNLPAPEPTLLDFGTSLADLVSSSIRYQRAHMQFAVSICGVSVRSS